jgi:adenylate cyclase
MLPSTAFPARQPAVLDRLRGLVLGPPAPEALPRRVQDAIRQEQDASEIIVTLIQFVAIGTFAVLYSLTPKAFPPNVPFEPVPLALAAYALFTLVRFGLAVRRRLRAWRCRSWSTSRS